MTTQLIEHMLFVEVYLDDVAIFSENIDEHSSHLRQDVALIFSHGLRLKHSNSTSVSEIVNPSGHIVSNWGIEVDLSKKELIQNIAQPKNQTDLRRFLEVAEYYRRFLLFFAFMSALLHTLTSTRTYFVWTEQEDLVFEKLKKESSEHPVPAFQNFEGPFAVEADASTVAVGAVLSQKKQHGRIHPVRFANRTMTISERKYSACESSALAGLFGLRKFRIYQLFSQPFVGQIDQQAFKATFAQRDIHVHLTRWTDFLADYDFAIRHQNGASIRAADFFPRVGYDDKGTPGMDEGEVGIVIGLKKFLFRKKTTVKKKWIFSS